MRLRQKQQTRKQQRRLYEQRGDGWPFSSRDDDGPSAMVIPFLVLAANHMYKYMCENKLRPVWDNCKELLDKNGGKDKLALYENNTIEDVFDNLTEDAKKEIALYFVKDKGKLRLTDKFIRLFISEGMVFGKEGPLNFNKHLYIHVPTIMNQLKSTSQAFTDKKKLEDAGLGLKTDHESIYTAILSRAPEKKGFIQKITGMFQGKPKQPTTPGPPHLMTTVATATARKTRKQRKGRSRKQRRSKH
jgi:hypothetical protein